MRIYFLFSSLCPNLYISEHDSTSEYIKKIHEHTWFGSKSKPIPHLGVWIFLKKNQNQTKQTKQPNQTNKTAPYPADAPLKVKYNSDPILFTLSAWLPFFFSPSFVLHHKRYLSLKSRSLSPYSLSNQASFPIAYEKLLSGITNWSGNSNSITVNWLWSDFRQGTWPEIIHKWMLTNANLIQKNPKPWKRRCVSS